MAQRLKRLPAMQETWVRSLVREDALVKEMATHSSVLAWRIPGMAEPGGLPSKKQRHYFTKKGPSSQSYSFSSIKDVKVGCFRTVVLEKVLESPLDGKEIQPVHPKGSQS